MNSIRFIWFLSALSTINEPAQSFEVIQAETPSGVRNIIVEAPSQWTRKKGRDEPSCVLCSLQGTLDGQVEIIDADTGRAVMTLDPSRPENQELLDHFREDTE